MFSIFVFSYISLHPTTYPYNDNDNEHPIPNLIRKRPSRRMPAYARARHRLKRGAGRDTAASESNQWARRFCDYAWFGSRTLRAARAVSGTCLGRMDRSTCQLTWPSLQCRLNLELAVPLYMLEGLPMKLVISLCEVD